MISASFPAFANKSSEEIDDAFLGVFLGAILTAGIGTGAGALFKGVAGTIFNAATAKTTGIVGGVVAGGAFGARMGSYGRIGREAIGFGSTGAFFGALGGGFGAAYFDFPSFAFFLSQPLPPQLHLRTRQLGYHLFLTTQVR